MTAFNYFVNRPTSYVNVTLSGSLNQKINSCLVNSVNESSYSVQLEWNAEAKFIFISDNEAVSTADTQPANGMQWEYGGLCHKV